MFHSTPGPWSALGRRGKGPAVLANSYRGTDPYQEQYTIAGLSHPCCSYPPCCPLLVVTTPSCICSYLVPPNPGVDIEFSVAQGTLITVLAGYAYSMLNCFNSSEIGPELVSYLKMAKTGPHSWKMNSLAFSLSYRGNALYHRRGAFIIDGGKDGCKLR
jgi:hypothetical protein